MYKRQLQRGDGLDGILVAVARLEVLQPDLVPEHPVAQPLEVAVEGIVFGGRRLVVLLVEIGQHIEDGNIEKIVEIDTAFHDVLYKASRNKRLAGIINNLREQITVIRRRSMMYPGRLQNTMEEHRILVDSIAAHDVDRAQNAARLHMENAEHTLLKDMLESAERKKK